MEVSVIRHTGEDTGRRVTLPDEVFGIQPNQHAVYLDIKHYLANQRQGTHKSQERSEVTGSTRKIKRQKGTGTARAGSLKSPIFRGGGRAFGPTPRSYSFKLNKKVKRLARRSALSYKYIDGAILVLEDFTFDAPKTKRYVQMMQQLQLCDRKTLLVTDAVDKNLVLASRNLKRAKVVTSPTLNTYDVLNADRLLLSERALADIARRLS